MNKPYSICNIKFIFLKPQNYQINQEFFYQLKKKDWALGEYERLKVDQIRLYYSNTGSNWTILVF